MQAVANRIGALSDWRKVVACAEAAGRHDLVAKHQFPEGAGYRKIDKANAALTKELRAAGIEVYKWD
jgi:hypothetical protein